jgi:hypothetical protein
VREDLTCSRAKVQNHVYFFLLLGFKVLGGDLILADRAGIRIAYGLAITITT